MRIGFFSAAIALATTGALAAPPAEERPAGESSAEQVAVTDTADEEEAEPERKICRTQKVTGSLTRRNRICLTQTQWREIHDRTRRGVDELQGSASGASSCVSSWDLACRGPDAMGVPAP
jgi:hypothetical protein